MSNKKSKITAYYILATVAILIMITIVASAAMTNTGTDEDPYEIRTAEDLNWFAEQVNGGNTAICGKLMNDIDLNPGYTFTFQPDTGLVKVEKAGEGIKGYFGTGIRGDTSGENNICDDYASIRGFFYNSDETVQPSANALVLPQLTPIGTNENRYTGTFDGNGKTVSGLVLYMNTQNDYVGLFGSVDSGGTVKNVAVASSCIFGKLYIGGICGDNAGGTIMNCSSSAIVFGNAYVGGICGNLSGGDITCCFSIGKYFGQKYVGSVLGNNADGAVVNCYYLTGSAMDTRQTPQCGIGHQLGGSYTADISGSTEGKTAEEFAGGSVTYALNIGSIPYFWYQKDGVPALIPYTPATLNDDYYEIRTAEDLFWFAAQTNGLNATINGKLMNDINLNPDYTFTFEPDTGLVKMAKAGGATVYLGTGIKGESGGIDTFDDVASLKGSFYSSNTAPDTIDEPTDLVQWTPISNKYDFAYRGIFDGCGHVIKNLYINNPEADDQGLFGQPDGPTIKNLGLLDCTVIGNNNVGGIVGITSYASVNTCFVTGVVAGNGNVGGIYGSFDNNSATKVISAASVLGTSNVGVIAGSLENSPNFSDSIGLKDNSIPLFGSGTNQGENVIALDDLSTGEACFLMNGNSSLNPTWFQNIGEGGDECPLLDSTHGVVYQTNDGYASCNEHIRDGSGFCGRCGCFLSDGLEPNEAGAFEIDNAKKLLWFSYYVEYNNAAANAILTSDIDLSEVCGDGIGSWKPIGDISKFYKGKFDGNNHTVSNLYINSSSLPYSALFVKTEKGAEITNLSIENADITCTSNASILVYSNSGLISHCSVSGSIAVTGNYKSVGGVCANSFGTITDCSGNATVIVNGNNNYAGGVCGKNNSYSETMIATVTGCLSTGSVTATGDNNNIGPVISYDSNTAISVVTNNYYLAASETDSLEGTTFKTEEQLASGEVAWLLNTAGKNEGEDGYIHTGVWSQGAAYPIFADATHPATYKVTLSGAVTATDKYVSGTVAISTDDGAIKADGTYGAVFAITGAQPVLGSSITMVYDVNILTSLVGNDAPQMVFTYHGKTYTVDGKAGVPVGDYTPYTFDFTEISPQCMGDSIDAVLTIGGKSVTKTDYSLKVYCDKMLAKSDAELTEMLAGNDNATTDELKTLLNDILLYGASSQMYKNYKTDALVGDLDQLNFENLTSTDREISGTKNESAYFTAMGLWFDNINKIYWKIAVSDENLSKLTVNVYRDGETTPCGTALAKFSNGIYIVYSEDITATSFKTKYTAVITYDGNEAQAVTYSVNSYIYSMQGSANENMANLAKATYNYGKSALAYNTAE